MDAPGQSTAKQLADTLASQTKVKIVKLPVKDAGEMHKRGMYKEFLKALYDAKPYRPEAVVEGPDLKVEDFRKNKQPGVEIPYPKLQKMTWGLRKGEITLVVSGPGLGKSTFVRELCYDLSLKGFKIANIALETPLFDIVNTYVAMDNKIPSYKLMFNQETLSDSDYTQSFEKLYHTGNMNFFEWWGSIESDRLINKMNYFVKSLGVDFIMLDHISIAIAGENDERLEIDRLFEKLTRLVVETGVGIIAVMHLRKVPGKNFNRGGEVELEDIRGSAGAAQMSWNVWALERDQQGDNKDLLRTRVLKNRALGFTGPADHLMFNHMTGRLEAIDSDYE
jgi:twinkle protein